MLRLGTQLLIRREGEVSRPIDDLAVGVVRLLSTERRPADEALEHDSAHTPPVTALVVALATEDLGGDVIRGTNSRVSQLPARLAPGVDLVAIRYRQLNLIDADRVAILVDRFRAGRRHELLVVRRGMLFREASGETEIGELDVSTPVQEDVVGFDVTAKLLALRRTFCQG